MTELSQLELALDRWREWDAALPSRPVLQGPLDGGLSNHSYLVRAGNLSAVVRVNGPARALPGGARSGELKAWRAASAAAIAPRLLCADEEAGFLVSAFVEDDARPGREAARANAALDLLRRWHEQDVELRPIDYAGHVAGYWRLIGGRGTLRNRALAEQREPMRRLLEELAADPGPVGPCHHDPVAANFVGTAERLYLLDWEYAAHGWQVLDYAGFAVEWGVDDSAMPPDFGHRPGRLKAAKTLYRYLCALWEEARPASGDPAP